MLAMPDVFIPVVLRLTRANREFITAEGARAGIERQRLRPSAYGPPAKFPTDLRVQVAYRHGWPVYSVAPRDRPARGSVVYVHGGGWIHDIDPAHWRLVAQIASRSRTTVVVPIWPLLPWGHADEVVATTTELLAESSAEYGTTSLAGDSAGGGIALAAAQQYRDRSGQQLAQTVLISPALDLTWSNPAIPAVSRTDPWLGIEGGAYLAEQWRGTLALTDPIVSPLYGDMTGLGPVTLFSGTRDSLNPDAHVLAKKLTAGQVPFQFHERAGQVHVYPLLPTPTGGKARRQIVTALTAGLQR